MSRSKVSVLYLIAVQSKSAATKNEAKFIASHRYHTGLFNVLYLSFLNVHLAVQRSLSQCFILPRSFMYRGVNNG